MVSPDVVESLISGVRLSSVGPAAVTPPDLIYEPSNMDLAMKLHYLRGVYFFSSSSVEGFTIPKIKETMFQWLELYYHASGRFRRSESGRPFIKCNDCGVRFIEAKCSQTLDEWLEIKDFSTHCRFVSNQVIGPELPFSPLVLLQITWFKCGGMAVGVSWAHVLGDAFSASNFINMWGQVLAGNKPELPPYVSRLEKSEKPPSLAQEPLSVKRVDPVGDNWVVPGNCKMEMLSFRLAATQLDGLQSRVSGQKQKNDQAPLFECICAVIWQSLAKIREGPEPRIVTICRKEPHNRGRLTLSNNQMISVAKADFSVVEAKPKDLVELIAKPSVNENTQIEKLVKKDQGLMDFVFYGANLTFVDLGGSDLYGLELNKTKPVFVNYTVDGVGDEGVIFVLPEAKVAGEDGRGGQTVTLILPENQLMKLKDELKREWSIK
ncbi:PREDICTED: protein ECERIFERUM 26-like [Nelumbo nucifera]|uniref:Protein ECERIFERUM 26-like n=2 Tax=Nelumbo nucifera TaxID=4432 RepID=A0A1U7YT46_NELNU|nr:PREDICTED: protein ECERIFERUM 26-like [Nelumbo nucifera]DAD24172.1 TPA_asm: hypothetical protein HUJ06_025635 [Nelumbo nucifera]